MHRISHISAFIAKIWHRLLKIIFGEKYFTNAYAQEGEDILLNRIFNNKSEGFYIDIGAHHPKRFSNTYLFYKKKWKGLNIDAMPGSMRAFSKKRPRDINVELAVMEQRGIATYFKFNDPALNGFSEQISLARNGFLGHVIEDRIEIEGQPLFEILNQYMPKDSLIDFMTIDVEGMDFEVLRSNDWSRYRPKLVLVEILVSTLEDILLHPIYSYMKLQGYTIHAKTLNTVFFIDKKYITENSLS